jgi:hypothetical protein
MTRTTFDRPTRFATPLLLLGLSAAVALLSADAIWAPPSDWSEQGHRLLLRGTRPAAEGAASFFQQALDADPASPYRWADLGEAFDESDRTPEAGRLFDRATELGPSSPPVLLRAGFHWLKAGDRAKALTLTSRVLEISELYDDSIFSLYRRFQIPAPQVRLHGLGEKPRAWRSCLKWLVSLDRDADAAEMWKELGRKGFRTEAITTDYLEYMIRKRNYAQVPAIWEGFAGSRAKGYGRGGVIFNGGFEAPQSKSPVEWKIVSEAGGVEAEREQGIAKEGEWSLTVRFPGRANVRWAGASQLVVVQPGQYRLRAWWKSDHVTTDHGPQFEVRDADAPERMMVRSEPVRGTHDWSRVEVPFQVSPVTAAVVVGLVRLPSEKFDNKVAGTIWVDGVEIVRGAHP